MQNQNQIEAVNCWKDIRLILYSIHTDLAKNVIHKLQEDLIHVKVILGTSFAEAHSTYSRGKL